MAVARALARRYVWAKDGFGDLLMMALPHHVDTLVGANGQDAAFVMKDSYQCIKVREGWGSRSPQCPTVKHARVAAHLL